MRQNYINTVLKVNIPNCTKSKYTEGPRVWQEHIMASKKPLIGGPYLPSMAKYHFAASVSLFGALSPRFQVINRMLHEANEDFVPGLLIPVLFASTAGWRRLLDGCPRTSVSTRRSLVFRVRPARIS